MDSEQTKSINDLIERWYGGKLTATQALQRIHKIVCTTRVGGLDVVVDPTIPPNEVRFVQDGRIVGVIRAD